MAHKAGDISHWYGQMFGATSDIPVRPALSGDISVDVAIVGGGYTGLWTAYELLKAQPDLSVVVLEAEFVGFGPSGRNGGAVIAQIVGSRSFWNKRGGPDGAYRMERAVQQGINEIKSVVEEENIDCSFTKAGVLIVARNRMEEDQLKAGVEADRKNGFSEADSVYLNAKELSERIRIDHQFGARFSPHSGSHDPGKLVRGLADAVERRGGKIFEGTRVTEIVPHAAITEVGTVTAKYVIRATEAYTSSIEPRRIIPVYTTMISTDVIPEAIWSEIGWQNRETVLAEHPFLHLQHTADHRITIGGDNPKVPYQWGSGTSAEGKPDQKLIDHYYGQLIKLFPALDGIGITSEWAGVFGAPRDWAPSVGLDENTGLGWAGGYVGEGVVASNMAGRTMKDLILGQSTDMTKLPWVRKQARKWELEPFRWVGAQAIFRGRLIGEHREEKTGKASKIVEYSNRIAGFSGHLG